MAKCKNSSHIPSMYLALAAVLTFLSCPMVLQAAESDNTDKAPIEETCTMIKKYVETRRLISQEKRDFILSKEMLNERIALVKREIESLQCKIKDARQSIDEADKKRIGMIEENDRLKNASALLSGVLETLEGRIQQMLPRLPEPIRQRIKPLSQRLPEKPDETKLSISERFQNIVGILNEVDKFNREISVTSEVRSLPDGSSVEVAAIYLGIGQAFYASADGKVAGIGTVGKDGWMWIPRNEASAQIADAISILKNEKVAAFVPLPVEIH